MGLESACITLGAQLRSLHEALDSLHTTVVEDRPLSGDVVLVDVFGDAADDLLGWLAEAIEAARDAQQAATYPTNLDRMRRALVICQERFNCITQRFSTDLICYERMDELVRFGRTHAHEWRAWASTVKDALDCCQQPLFDVGTALFGCWQEFAERATLQSELRIQN